MSRRNFLAGLGGLGLGGAVARGAAAAPVMASQPVTAAWRPVVEVATVGQMAKAAAPSPAQDAFYAASRVLFARQKRQERVQELLGGLPPHLASMKSCAPWFRAQRAVAWEEARQDGMTEAFRALRDSLGLGEREAP